MTRGFGKKDPINTNTKGPNRKLLWGAYLFLLLVCVVAPTDLVIREMVLESYGYRPEVHFTLYPISFGGIFFLLMGLLNVIRAFRAATQYEYRTQLSYMIGAIMFPFLGGIMDLFPTLPPAGMLGNVIFCLVTSIAVLKHHLLDIRIVARKSLVYLLVSVVISIPYVSLIYLLHYIFEPKLGPWWMHGLIILLLAIILRPLYTWAQQLVDRLFYRDRYDNLRALEQFSQEAQSIMNLEELGSKLVQLVSGALRVSSSCLLLLPEGRNDFVVISSTGLASPPSGVVLQNNSPLTKWLELHGDILSSEQLNVVPQLQGLSLREKSDIEKMGAKFFVPIKRPARDLSGVLVLGQKLSQQTYDSEDKHLLVAISSQMAIVLENARLYSNALQARETLERWLDSMTDCVMIVNRTYTVEFMNRAAIDKLGSRVGENCWDATRKETTCPGCPIQNYARGNKKELHYNQNIGDKEYDIVAASLSNPDGSLSIIEVLRDITERKQMEEREKQLQEELSPSRRLALVGELAAGIAHEVNNPLTGILGFSQRLLRKSTDETTSRDLERIHNEAQRAAKVVRNLLTFARRHEPKKEYSDINESLKKTLELRAYELRTGNIELTVELAPDIPAVMADFDQMQEVFFNIILNAEQAMTKSKGGGKLTINSQKMDGYIRFSLTDDGPGISAKHLDKLFDPFFTTRGGRGGTGLGLSVCHGIVTEHGGKIYAKSKPGKGATFIVELPYAVPVR